MPACLSYVGLLIERNKRILDDRYLRTKLPHNKSNNPRVACRYAVLRHNSDGSKAIVDQPVFFEEVIQNGAYRKNRQSAMEDSVNPVLKEKEHRKSA